MPESKDERHNRELIELLNELRVALPGVQVLFAFLLAVPFASGFPKLGRLDRDVFFAALIATAALTIAGLAMLAVAITYTVFVITDLLFHRAWAATFTGLVAAAFLALWYGLPLASLLRDLRRPRPAR